jgi:long-chain acyl-CoA synthetase
METPKTMLHLLHQQAERLGDRPALWTKREGAYQPISWREYAERVKRFALGLHGLGFKPGDALCILSFNREEWLVAELAAMSLGGVAVGIYTTSSPDQIQYVARHCECELMLVENEAQLCTIEALRHGLPKLRQVVVIDPPANQGTGPISYADVSQSGRAQDDAAYFDSLEKLEATGLATLIYTSGTTGQPKGVMLSHRNLVWTTQKLSRSTALSPDDVVLSYLPLSHIAEQICSIHGPVMNGIQVYFAESLDALAQNIREVRPTVFFGVPRVWEKFKARAEQRIGEEPEIRRRLVAWARRVTLERNYRALAHERIPLGLEVQYQLARRQVFSKLKRRIGFDRARVFVTSAAPIGKDVLDFFASLDMIIREIYGQSEVTGPTSVNTEEATKLGSLGRPLIGVQVKIAGDGEILVRGENVCMGYYKDPQATAALIHDGWLHSGDVGELDDEGYLRITGRKKEIIVTSGGKKTAPAYVETLLRSITPLGNALVIGEGRNYLVALLTLDAEKVQALARERGWPENPGLLSQHPDFLQYLDQKIDRDVNSKLAQFETVKKFAILTQDLGVETGELTPTMKIKRQTVERKFAELIDSLYAEPSQASRDPRVHRLASGT